MSDEVTNLPKESSFYSLPPEEIQLQIDFQKLWREFETERKHAGDIETLEKMEQLETKFIKKAGMSRPACKVLFPEEKKEIKQDSESQQRETQIIAWEKERQKWRRERKKWKLERRTREAEEQANLPTKKRRT